MLPGHIYSWVDVETASERFKRILSELESDIRNGADFHRREIEKEFQERIRMLEVAQNLTRELKESDERIKSYDENIDALKQLLESWKSLKFFLKQARGFFVLYKTRSPLVIDFVKESSKGEFWHEGYKYLKEDPHILWYMLSMDISNEFVDRVIELLKDEQTVKGRLSARDSTHPGALRVLVKADPLSDNTFRAAEYWVNFRRNYEAELKPICLGILALAELDFERYKSFVIEESERIKELQLEDGSFTSEPPRPSDEYERLEDTCYAIWALSTTLSPDDLSVRKAVSWVHKILYPNTIDVLARMSVWLYSSERDLMSLVLIALLSAGEGPKVPLELVEVEMMKQRQKIQYYKPKFLHTSPNYIGYKSVKEIYEQISRMLKEAKTIIRISSPFIDVFYDEIANLLDEKPGLVIKIIARPKSDIAGPREKIAKNAIEQLNKSTGGNVVTSKLVHSRLIIIDEDEMLVSSADLTRDSLFDEFNSGIWTRDKEAIGEATEFFDNLYEYCKESQKRPSNGGLD